MSEGLSEKELTKLFSKFSLDELAEMVGNVEDIAQAKSNLGPQTKEELWWTFKEKFSVELSRIAVCEGHTSQLDLVWEVYSFQVGWVLWVLSRGAGKTFLMALTDYLQCDYFPGFQSFTIGPGRSQGERKYDHILPYVIEGGVIGGKEKEHIARSILTRTEWWKGSVMEIALGGEPENANGPRVPRMHRDEIELMKAKTRKQAANIPAGKMSRDGRMMPAQIVDTSTMKWAGHYVDVSIEEYNEALEKGVMPRQQVRISCIFEATEENPACRCAPAEMREARLIELERDPTELCPCDKIISGIVPTEDPEAEAVDRTMEMVCQGRFFRSRGHKTFGDVITLFQANEPEEWDAEQECSQPAREGAYIHSYSQLRNGIKGWEPNPDFGDIYTSIDWGGADEHSHGWYQILDHEVETYSYKSGLRKVLPAGSEIRFGEIYINGIGDMEVGEMVIEREKEWKLRWPGWQVKERFCDYASATAKANWRDKLGLIVFSRVKKDFVAEVKMIRTRVGSQFFYVDIKACPMFDKAIRAWRQENGHEVHDWATHPMAEFRYLESNIQVFERQAARNSRAGRAQIEVHSEDDLERVERRHAEVERQIVTYRGGAPGEELELYEVGGAMESSLANDRRSDRVMGQYAQAGAERMGRRPGSERY